jgi:hypothetical protein
MAPVKVNLQTVIEGIIAVLYSAGLVISSPFVRRWYSRWGANQAEVRRQFPGDELVPFPKIQSTRSITISCQPKDIWQWLVQMGYRRAGWYSYDILEMITGGGEFVDGLSARRIIPELQLLEPGSQIYVHPRMPAFAVDNLQLNELIVLVTRIDSRTGLTYSLLGKRPLKYFSCTRIFLVEKLTDRESRLIVRSRFDYSSSFVNVLIWRVFTDPISFVMERKMLLNIKKRVESVSRLDWQTARKLIGIK